MMRVALILFLTFSTTVGSKIAQARSQALLSELTVDERLRLAENLTQEQLYERAETILLSLSEEANKDSWQSAKQKSRYQVLKGLIALSKKDPDQAITHFQNATGFRPGLNLEVNPPERSAKSDRPDEVDPLAFVYLAQAYFAVKRFQACLQSLEQVPELVSALPRLGLLQARSLWQLNRWQASLSALEQTMKQHPSHLDAHAQWVVYIRQLGLSNLLQRKLTEWSQQHADDRKSAADFLKILAALQRPATSLFDAGPSKGGQALAAAPSLEENMTASSQAPNFPKLQATWLEAALLLYPINLDLLKERAILALRQNALHTAQRQFERAAAIDPSYYEQAAELALRNGFSYRSLQLNARIPDPKAKLKQRLSLFLKTQSFAQVVGLESALRRHRLLEDPDHLYGLAYAFFRLGDFVEAQKRLNRLQDARLLGKALALRQQMATCSQKIWSCS